MWWRRLGQFLFISAGATGVGVLGSTIVYDQPRLDLYNLGVMRFGRAAITVAAIGIDYRKTLKRSSELEKAEYERLLSETHEKSAGRLLQLCQDNGGCFTKVGQHIGALDYLLPEEYVSTMRVLHNRAPEMNLSDVYRVIKEDLSRQPEELFSEFDEKPLGTASLAQVHRAVLRETGEEVAVKVQHQHVKKHSFVDMYTMDFLVHTINYVFPQFEFMWLAEEGRNAEKVSDILRHFSWLKIPKIYWSLTTDRVLVMDYYEGAHINDVDRLRAEGINLERVARNISRMYADMIFKYGYVHCDPHPGNVLVRKSHVAGGEDEVVLLDHGLYSHLTHDFRLNYSRFWLSILNADTEGIQKYSEKLGIGQLYGLFACMVSGRSWDAITQGLDKAGNKTAQENEEIRENAARYVKEITDVLAYVNQQMILIFKTNDLLRTIEFNLGAQNSMVSFVQMSRACLRCLNAERLRLCDGFLFCRLRCTISGFWDQFKISCYQVFLWLYCSPVGVMFRNR